MFMNSRIVRAVVRNYSISIFRMPTPAHSVPIKYTSSRLAINQYNIKSFGSVAAANEPFLDPKIATDRIIEVVKNFEKVDAIKVSPIARFKEDLDLDSLDAVEVVMAIEEEFGIEIPDSEADKILSISDAVAYISSHPMAK